MTWVALNAWLALAPSVQPGTVPNPKAQSLQLLGTFLIMGIMLYLVMIRPQQKKAKEHAALVQTLEPGDKVLTSSGILGVVVSVKDKSVAIRSADSKLEVLKSAVTEITEKTSKSAVAS